MPLCLSLVFLLINYFFLLHRHDSLSDGIQALQPFKSSECLHINGTHTHLGQASPIYIINLPSRHDRRTESIGLIQRLNLEAFLVPAYSIHSAEVRRRHRTHTQWFFKLTELACWTSHMRLWVTIADTSLSPNESTWSLVFEDDVDLELDIVNVMQSFPASIWSSADLIYLGHCANPPGHLIYQSSEYVYRVHQALHPSCTHAYAIRSSSAEKLVALLDQPRQPIDDSIITLVQQSKLIAYSIHPPLAIQKPISNRNPSDVNQTDRQSWMYRLRLSLYTLLQWYNGVELGETLYQSTLERVNLSQADQWRRMHEHALWKAQG